VVEVTELQTEVNLLTSLPAHLLNVGVALASTMTLGSKFHGTHDHILLCDGSGSWDTRTDLWTGWYTGTRAQNWDCLGQIRMYGRAVGNLTEETNLLQHVDIM
jgi:hypothetical protein